MEEIWKDIKNYEGLYQISNLGKIKGLSKQDGFYYLKERLLKPVNNFGYQRIILSKNKIKKNYFIHKLVAEAFIPNPNNYPIVNHKDGNKENNCVNNLEWCSHKQNTEHAVKNNLIKHNKIGQYDKKGNLIKIYNSRYDIKNIDTTSITRVCNGKRKSAGGYIWKYVN